MTRMMLHSRKRRKGIRARWLLPVLLASLLLAAGFGAYGLYTLRARQNTRKLLTQAKAATVAENWDTAVVAYRQYLRRSPEDLVALRAYADVLLEKTRTKPEALRDAIRTLRRLVGVDPDDTWTLEKLTGIYLGLRQYESAEELARRWTAVDPQSTDAVLVLAFAHRELRKPDEAVEVLTLALDRNPEQPALFPLLIKLLTELDRLSEAEMRLEVALRSDSESPNLQLVAFALHERRGDSETAERHLRKALQLAPETLDTILPAAAFFLSNHQLAEVETLLDDATRIAPGNRRVLTLRAAWARQQGTPATLAAAADELLNHARDTDFDLIAQAAELYLRADRLDGTDECLARLEAIPNAAERLGASLDRIKGARALQGGRPFVATSHFLSALRREPSSVQTNRLLAAAYVQAGDLEAAAETFRRVAALAPTDVRARLRLAELGWQQGRLTEVRHAVGMLPEATDAQQLQADLIKLACELRQAGGDRGPLEVDDRLLRQRERVAAIKPPDLATARWAGRCLVMLGQPEQAVQLLHRETSDSDDKLGLGSELGRLMARAGHGKRALALADDLLQEFPDALEGHVLRVNALCTLTRFDEASEHVEQSQLPAKDRGRLLETLADAHWAAERIESALSLLRRGADLVATNLSVRQKLAHRTPNLDEALQRIEELRAIEGEAGLHWRYELAGALLRLDPSEQSVTRSTELLERCLADRRQWPAARLLLAYGYELSGALQNAVETYKEAIADQPTMRTRSAMIRLVSLLRRLGRFAEADTLLNTLAARAPEAPEVLRLRIKQLIRRRNFDSALTTAEHLIQLQPDDPAWVAVAADLYIRTGDPAQAEAVARPALVRFPSSVPILWSLTQALIAQSRGDEAEAEAREASAAAGDASHLLLLAHVLAKRGQLESAELVVADALELHPEDGGVWASCADFWGRYGKRSRQIACARKAIELRGEDPAKSAMLASLLAAGESADDLAEADRIVRQRLAEDPNDASALLIKVKLALTQKALDLPEAEADMRRALASDPRSPDVHRLLAAIQARAGEFSRAAETVATGLAFSPTNTELLFSAAEIGLHRGQYQEAIEQLQHLLELTPRSLGALRLLTIALRRTGQLDRAIELLEKTSSLDTMTPVELLLLARLREIKGDLAQAEKLYSDARSRAEEPGEALRESIQFYARRDDHRKVHALAVARRGDQPQDVRTWLLAAGILGAQSSDDALRETGLGWLEEIARAHPAYAGEAMFQAGTCHYRRGDLNVAESEFLRAIRRAPESWEPVNALAWLYAVDLGRPAEARAFIDKFLESGGRESATLMDTHATVLLRLRELNPARRKLEQCLRIVGETSTKAAANYHLGLVLREMGLARDALPYIQRGLRLAERLGGLTDKERSEARRLAAEGPSAEKREQP